MIYDFDNPFVFWTPVNNHQELKETLVPIIKKLSCSSDHTVTVDGSTTSYYHQQYNYFTAEMAEAFIWEPLEKMHDEKNIKKPRRYGLDALWWNNYEPGGRTKVHKHERSDWSGIYLLHLNEPNTTTFYSQYGESPNSGYMNQYKMMDQIHEGCVMIFPSFLQHCAESCSENRIVISYDIISEYDRSPLTITPP